MATEFYHSTVPSAALHGSDRTPRLASEFFNARSQNIFSGRPILAGVGLSGIPADTVQAQFPPAAGGPLDTGQTGRQG